MDKGSQRDGERAVRRRRATQLSFALYAAGNRMVRLHKPILEPMGLTFPQYLVLAELLAKSPRTVGELGARVDMDAGTISPLLKRLEAAGKVARMRDPEDERCVLVSLTEVGEQLRDAISAVTDQVKSACEAPDLDLDHLRQQLDQLAQPVDCGPRRTETSASNAADDRRV